MAAERQVAIVTGAASGIGRAMTLGLLEGGIDVAAVDREASWLEELKAATAGKGAALHTIRADLSDPASSTMRGSARVRSARTSAAIRCASGRLRRSNGTALSRSMRPHP